MTPLPLHNQQKHFVEVVQWRDKTLDMKAAGGAVWRQFPVLMDLEALRMLLLALDFSHQQSKVWNVAPTQPIRAGFAPTQRDSEILNAKI